MLRLLAIVALAIFFWLVLDWLFTQVRRALGIAPADRRGAPGGRGARTGHRAGAAGAHRSSPKGVAEALVRCPACGTYVPTSRTLPVGRSGGVVACSEECRERLRQETKAGGDAGADAGVGAGRA